MLLAAAAGYEGEAAVAAIAHIMRQQRLSPYAAAVAARYQHTALHVRSLFILILACRAIKFADHCLHPNPAHLSCWSLRHRPLKNSQALQLTHAWVAGTLE